jgi:hypothetical protein
MKPALGAGWGAVRDEASSQLPSVPIAPLSSFGSSYAVTSLGGGAPLPPNTPFTAGRGFDSVGSSPSCWVTLIGVPVSLPRPAVAAVLEEVQRIVGGRIVQTLPDGASIAVCWASPLLRDACLARLQAGSVLRLPSHFGAPPRLEISAVPRFSSPSTAVASFALSTPPSYAVPPPVLLSSSIPAKIWRFIIGV